MRALSWVMGVCLVLGSAGPSAPAQDKKEVDITGRSGSPGRTEDKKDKEVDITGHYTWEGIKDGEDYAIQKNGEVYQVAWRLKSGTWIGVAIRDGDRLSVAWDFPNGGNLGVAVYKIEKGDKGPSLVGKWAAYQDKLTTKDNYKWSRKLD